MCFFIFTFADELREQTFHNLSESFKAADADEADKIFNAWLHDCVCFSGNFPHGGF